MYLNALSQLCCVQVKQLINLGKPEDAKKAVEFFEADVKKIDQESTNIPPHIQFDTTRLPKQYIQQSKALLTQAAKAADHHRIVAKCYVETLENNPKDTTVVEELETCVSLLQSTGEDTSEFDAVLERHKKKETSEDRPEQPNDTENIQKILESMQNVQVPGQQIGAKDEKKLIIEKAREGLRHLKEGKQEEAEKIKLELLGLTKDPEQAVSQMALRCDNLDDSIALYEYTIAAYPESSSLYSHQGNMACMMHSKSTALAEGTAERRQLEEKCRETFILALSHDEACSSTRMDYGVFLHQMNDLDTLVPLLEQIITDEKPKVATGNMSGNCYGLNEKNTVDENIKREIEARRGEVSIASIFHAFYIKVISNSLKHK